MMSTKERILEAALKLFNESNTQAATTNHIAKEAGISVGNLHYHYKNREAIICELYKQKQALLLRDPKTQPMSIEDLHYHYNEIFEVSWKYRFFQRELLFLLSRNADLKKRYVEDNQAHRVRIIEHMKHLNAEGMIEIKLDNIYENIADSILMSSQFWIAFLETLGRTVTQESLRQGVLRLHEIVRPFLTSKALKILARLEREEDSIF